MTPRALIAAATLSLLFGACAGEAPEGARRPMIEGGGGTPTFDFGVGPGGGGGQPTFDAGVPPDTATPSPDSQTSSPPPSTGACKQNEQGFGGRCYRVIDGTPLTYANAKSACAGFGMTVASLESRDEDTFVYGLLPKSTSAAWIGLVRTASGHVWDATNKAPKFRHWATGEPNNEGGNEACVVMWGPALSNAGFRGKWNDAPCSAPTRDTVVCER